MRRIPRFRISGRAAIAALVVVSLAIAGGILLLPRKALAAPGTTQPTMYGPLLLQERSVGNGIDTVQIALLVPAVQAGDTPVSVHALTSDGLDIFLRVPPSGGQSMSFFDIFVEITIDGFKMTLRNRQTGDEASAPLDGPSTGLAVRLMPGMRRNGQPVLPLSARTSATGTNGVIIGSEIVQVPSFFDIDPFL